MYKQKKSFYFSTTQKISNQAIINHRNMFTNKDVADYYNTTLNHYQSWWNLDNHLSLHYGIWEEGINSFAESLVNTNKTLMKLANISASDKVLDAGSGVGGAAMFLADQVGANVVGITLSQKQFEFASLNAIKKGLNNKVQFHLMDYTQTNFEDESFDVVWACESVSSATNKAQFIKEAFRLLKKGGRLILSDFFIAHKKQIDKNLWMKKWGSTWSISQFDLVTSFCNTLTQQGFCNVQSFNYTDKIRKSAKRMYYTALLGAIPSELYNLFHPKVSRFAKTHYKCGYYQYKALQENLWKYEIILAIK